jgi:hypothetical protein
MAVAPAAGFPAVGAFARISDVNDDRFAWALCGRSSQVNSTVAATAPAVCATTKPGTSMGRMPAKVLVTALAGVTAGLANDVDEVNQ